MKALRIDPDQRSVTLLELEPEAVFGILRAVHITSVDLDADHIVVIDDDLRHADRDVRFRFMDGAERRPFFGTALVFGLVNGNWAHVMLDATALQPRIIWETWEEGSQNFVRALAK